MILRIPTGCPTPWFPPGHQFVNVSFQYASESDAGPYPFGPDTPIEGGQNATGDRHAIMIDPATCTLYELYDAQYNSGGSTAGSGAIWNLRSNALRPAGWTSADAAGLPIMPGLLRYDEVQSGQITHAIRMTATTTDTSYLWPARHEAGARSDPSLPPMGARFRLKASFNISGYSAQAQVVLRAMQHYGLILADNGSNWYFGGTADPSWPQALVDELKTIPASAFEAVDESSLMVSPDSGQAGVLDAPGPGYRLVAADGGVFAFGDGFYGSAGALALEAPVVGTADTASGDGYWLVAKDGGVFSYGDAAFYGSMGAKHLDAPIVGMASHARRPRLLARGQRRWGVLLRRRRLLRIDGGQAPRRPHRGHGEHARRPRLLARGVGRWGVLLRRRRLLRVDGGGAVAQARGRHGGQPGRGLLARGVGRRDLLVRCPVLRVDRGARAFEAGCGHAARARWRRVLARRRRRRGLHVRHGQLPRLHRRTICSMRRWSPSAESRRGPGAARSAIAAVA